MKWNQIHLKKRRKKNRNYIIKSGKILDDKAWTKNDRKTVDNKSVEKWRSSKRPLDRDALDDCKLYEVNQRQTPEISKNKNKADEIEIVESGYEVVERGLE